MQVPENPDQPAPVNRLSADGTVGPPEASGGKPSGAVALRVIAVFKLCKAAVLVAVGVGLLRFLSHEQHQAAHEVVEQVRPDPHNRLIHELLSHVRLMSPATLKALSVGTFVYAGLFVIEGVGLLLRKRWAEWMVVLTTAGLLPVELYELAEKPTALRAGIVVVNAATVAYLVWQLNRTTGTGSEKQGPPTVLTETEVRS